MSSDMEKPPIQAAPFDELPDEIIEQILLDTDSNGFASLILLNRKWRAVSQRPHLYIHHLRQCPSFAISRTKLPPGNDSDLPRLRRLFAQQIKRNLFDAYLRPHQTTIKLISNSISSASCPGGEGMQFSTSPKSQLVLAYNSSRIYVIDVRAPKIEIKREFKTLRRPVATCILDDGSLLAILSMEMQVDLYDLSHTPPRRKQSIILDNTPRTIALSPCGSVLAAAYEGGIEVTSLSANAGPSDRRSVKCDAVDALAFSYDGTQILGTTVNSATPSTVILTAPYYDPGSLLPENDTSALWTTSILFPNSSRDCTHSVLIQDGGEDEARWTFAYDRSFETFRAVRINDLRNGTTYFVGPEPKVGTQGKLLPSTLSGATYYGEIASASFHHGEIWVYGVPERLDALTEEEVSTLDLTRGNNSHASTSREQDPVVGDSAPQWKLMRDRQRNTFRSGVKVDNVLGVSSVKWIAEYGGHSLKERLIVTATGVLGPRLVTEEEDLDFVDGGRIKLIDFDYGLQDGTEEEIILEVGTDKAEVLEEEHRDIETEVAIVRRRTLVQKRGSRSALLRAATTSYRSSEAPPPLPQSEPTDDDDPLLPRRIGHNPAIQSSPRNDAPEDPDVATIEEQEALDAPYAHSSPRTATTLRRAATAAAVNRTMNPRTADGRPISYRRADGRREHPHESDADNWVPPPPPYQKEDPGDLPAFLRGPAVPPMPPLPSNTVESYANIQRRPSHHRTASDSTTLSRPRIDHPPRPRSTPAPDPDDIYDATPPASPGIPAQYSSTIGENLERQASVSTMSSPADSPSSPVQNSNIPIIIAPAGDQERADMGHGMPLPSSQAWSTGLGIGPSQNPVHNAAAAPLVAPVPRMANAGFLPNSPPTLVTNQPAYVDPNTGHGHYQRPVSVGFHDLYNPNRPVFSPYLDQQRPSTSWNNAMDQPLIVSTPKGVSGGFDLPETGAPSRWAETTIAAPVPVRPRPRQGGSNPQAPVQRLESSVAPRASYHAPPPPAAQRQQSTLRPWTGWGRSRSISPGQVPVGVSRQSSRAERSAAKNIRDARMKGWKPKAPAKPKKKKKKDHDAVSNAGWTDVTTASGFKDRRCTVM